MSDRLKSTNSICNEEVIEDLTKDLELSLRSENKHEVNGSNEAEEAVAFDSTKASPSVEIPPKDLDDTDKNDEETDDDDSDTDSIDELVLKDEQFGLSDDQKAERLAIAELLKAEGNDAFREDDAALSIKKYTKALRTCPLEFTQQRAVLYCNRSAAKLKLGKYKEVIKDCTKAVELDDRYLKAYYRRAQSYEVTDKFDESLEDYKKILELDPSHKEGQRAMVRLPPIIVERNEKIKVDMLCKLQEMGNMILKPFGLSTQNFHMEKDPDTNGYKINFKQ